MASLNKVMLIGSLGKDPDCKFTQSGTAVCKFSIATTERVKKVENWEDKTEWHNIVCFGHAANHAEKYLKKGSPVFIEGKIQTSSWDDENGVKKYKTEILAESVKSLTKSQNENNSTATDNAESDLPF